MSRTGVIVAAALAAFTGTAAQADDHGSRATTLRTGAQPSSLVAARLSGSRHPDLAVANQGSDTISIFTARGNGGFHKAFAVPSGPAPRSIQAADVNEDGRIDLLTADSGSSTVSLLLGSRNGRFRPRRAIPVAASSAECQPIAILTADVTGDGHVDIAAACLGSNRITVLPGAGDGTFPTRIDAAGFVRDDPQALVAGDFNRDGRLDLATANFDSVSVSTLVGNGDGTFLTGPEYATGSVSFSLATADMNEDGLLDLVVANYARSDPFPFGSNSVSVLAGDGAGHFTILPPIPVDARPVSILASDFNGDSHADAAVASFDSNTVTILFGTGAGTFSRRVTSRTAAGPAALASVDGDRKRSSALAVANMLANTAQLFFLNADKKKTR
jgi:hypothetical protein